MSVNTFLLELYSCIIPTKMHVAIIAHLHEDVPLGALRDSKDKGVIVFMF